MTRTGFSRRTLLTGAATADGATAASLALPPNAHKGPAATPPRSFSPTEIKHVALVMQENRSSGYYFGTLPGVRGFADPTAIKLASTGKSVFYQPYSASPLGYLLPCHLDAQNTGA